MTNTSRERDKFSGNEHKCIIDSSDNRNTILIKLCK